MKKGFRSVNTMLTADPPRQRRYRSLCQKPFSASNVAKLQPYIESLAHELIDDFIDQGECDWMEAFAVPMPVRMIAYILGVPVSDMDLFKEWSMRMFIRFQQAKPERGLNAARLVVDFQHYFAEKIEARKSCPTDDVLSDIVNASADGETPMNIEECLSVISQLLVAGNETTTSTFAEGMHLLASHPEELKKCRMIQASCPIWLKKCSGFPRPRHRCGGLQRRIARSVGSPFQRRHHDGEVPLS